MTNITIPPEALKKSARSLARITHRNLSKIHTLTKTEDEFVEENWPAFVEHARAAFEAMVEHWPGAGSVAETLFLLERFKKMLLETRDD